MLRFQGNETRGRDALTRVLLRGAAALSTAAAFACALAPQPVRAAMQPATLQGAANPETLLQEIYRQLDADNLRQALAYADKLVAAYPTFHLGQLIRGDLLMMQTHVVTSFGPPNAPRDRLNDLREEAMVRLQSLRHRPDPSLLPRAVLQLRDDQKHVLLVDAAHSRLYVYENRGGVPHYVADYYVSQGKLGVNKLKAGDQKTPVGVYYITGHLPGTKLPEFYGTGALPINYPNEWDRLNGRSGYGIWLHGTPPDSYSRPPLSSDGCVVLTNTDLNRIARSVEIGKTPVVIAQNVEFVSKARWSRDRDLARQLLEGWQHDVESLDMRRLAADYSPRFKSERGEDARTWLARHEPFPRGAAKVSLAFSNVTSFFYPDSEGMIVTTFTQETAAGKSRSTERRRQYWANEHGQWKIVFELML